MQNTVVDTTDTKHERRRLSEIKTIQQGLRIPGDIPVTTFVRSAARKLTATHLAFSKNNLNYQQSLSPQKTD